MVSRCCAETLLFKPAMADSHFVFCLGFNASRDDDRATSRSDGRARRDGPTHDHRHDHGRPLRGRLNCQCRLALWDLPPALRTQAELELERQRRRQIRSIKDVSYFLLGSHYRDKEESPDSHQSSIFETSTRNHKSLRRRPLTRRWCTFDFVHTNGSASSL
jgi:hypothetical protein